jgi:ketosteroid isomerase-like protein
MDTQIDKERIPAQALFTRENIIGEMFRAIDAREWDRLPDFFAPGAVYERPGYEPFEGLERLDRFYRHERVIASGEHRLEAVLVDGGNAACRGRFVGVHRDGSPIDESFADFYRLADGRITHRRSFFFRPAV